MTLRPLASLAGKSHRHTYFPGAECQEARGRGSCFCTAESSEPLQVLPGYRREASQKRELGLMVKRSDERRVQNLWKTSGEVLGKTGSQNCGAGNGGKNCNKLDFCLFLFGHRVRKEAK